MKLVPCPSCSTKLSPQATTCANCGHPLKSGRSEKRTSGGWAQIGPVGRAALILTMGFMAYVYWPSSARDAEVSSAALGQMERAFIGGYSKEIIRQLIDPVMRMYGLPLTEDSYSRAGSTLVVMRKESDVPEVGLLQCMKTANQGGEATFSEMAAICSIKLQQK